MSTPTAPSTPKLMAQSQLTWTANFTWGIADDVLSDLYVRGKDRDVIPPMTVGGHIPEPEMDRLSNIIKAFNDHFGNITWADSDRIQRLITEDIPKRVAEDKAYKNALQHSDEQNARIEHDKALERVMTQTVNDDTELFRQFVDNEAFRRWMTETIFGLTYKRPAA